MGEKMNVFAAVWGFFLFSVRLHKNVLASLPTALEILSGSRHLLHNYAFLIARIMRYFRILALLDIHGGISFSLD
jgi:hypothetical protein